MSRIEKIFIQYFDKDHHLVAIGNVNSVWFHMGKVWPLTFYRINSMIYEQTHKNIKLFDDGYFKESLSSIAVFKFDCLKIVAKMWPLNLCRINCTIYDISSEIWKYLIMVI